jgi:hypothetical protein
MELTVPVAMELTVSVAMELAVSVAIELAVSVAMELAVSLDCCVGDLVSAAFAPPSTATELAISFAGDD